jgi:hypothetical protein
MLPPSLPRGARTVLFCVLLVLASCTREASAPAQQGSAERANASGAPARVIPVVAAATLAAPGTGEIWKPVPPRAFLPGRVRKLPPWGDDHRAKIDPAADGWPTEVLAVAVERRVREVFARENWNEATLAGALRPLGDEASTRTTALRPATPAPLFDDGNLTVARAAEIDRALHPWSELDALVAPWAKDFEGTRAPRAYLHVSGVRPVAGSRYETTIDLRLSATAGTGLVQQNLVWKATWDAPAKLAEPRLVELSLERFEVVRCARRVLEERTEQVFAGTPCWSEELLRGNGDYHLRQDRLTRQPYLGMHGIAIADVDGDGLEDIYLPQPGGQPNRLLLHRPDGTVVDAGEAAGVAYLDNSGPALLCDFDGDGDPDLAAAVGPHIVVSWNDGHGRFSNGVVLVGPDEPEITSMAAADPDRDGDLDIYACRYVAGGIAGGAPAPYFNADNGARNLYWRNDGKHTFKEAAAEVGLDRQNTRFSLGVIWDDYDDDGDDDLYVVNDFGRNCLYRNDGGKFTDVAEEAGLSDQAAGMGVTCADADLDGKLDFYVTNMHSPEGGRIASQPQFMPAHPEQRPAYVRHARGNTLLRNLGGGRFEDVTEEAGVAAAGWAWGSMFFDLDDDRLPDLYVPNGFATADGEPDLASFFWRRVVGRSPPGAETDQGYVDSWDASRHFAMFEGLSWNGHERNYAYLNLGGMRFADASAAFSADVIDDTRLAAPIDWDDDGRIDLLLRNRTGPRVRLLRNTGATDNRSLALELAGTRGNRDAIGAQVELEAGGKLLRQRVYSAQGFMCAPSRRLHFGLGRSEQAEKVVVRWPNGARESFGTLAAGARYRLVEGSGRAERVALRPQEGLARAEAHELVAAARPVERVVLCDRMPIAPLEVPCFEGTAGTIGASCPEGLLISILLGSDPASRASLEALAPRTRGLAHAVLATDETKDLAATRAWIASLGLGARAGPADRRFLQALEVVLIEVLGPFEKLPLPLHLLVDREGQLAVFHCGASDPATIAADYARVRALGPGRSTDALLGGFWAQPPSRDLASVAQIFHTIGRSELARAYQSIAHGPGR